jgi:ribose 5-phosphate isomerase B
MIIAIGADHRGVVQKAVLKEHLSTIEWVDVGCFVDQERCEYPIYARLVAQQIQLGRTKHGILLCGSGVGMAVAANRFEGIYAALVWNAEIARVSKEHDNSNVVVIPSDFLRDSQVIEIVSVWLKSEFLKGKYKERTDMIATWGGLQAE